MTPEQIFISVSGAVAALLGIGALIAALREPDEDDAADTRPATRADAASKYEPDLGTDRAAGASYGTAVRVLWWVSIATVLVGVGLTDSFGATQPAIYLVGATAVAVVVIVHDLLPARWRTPVVSAFEILAALGLTTALLMLTGYGASPFVYAYHLVAVAVALALGGRIALGVAALASLAYLGVLVADPGRPAYASGDLLRFALTLGSIWLLAYLAGVYASGERRMRNAVLQLSRTDSLTGLFNRSQLFPTLEQEVQRTRRSERGFCLLMIDLDGLKAVNDSFGHHRGDSVLTSLGGVIRRSIRLVDNAYRYGGDEFLVLLPETDFTGAFVVAEKIRAGAEEVGLAAGGGELLTSVSIGLVSCPEDGTTSEELMIAADRAMYQAKSLGKNQVSGNPRPRRLTVRESVEVEELLRPQAPAPSVRLEEQAPIPEAPPAQAAASFTVEPDTSSPAPGPGPAPEPAVVGAAADQNGFPDPVEEDEPDPNVVRRQIAAARRNMDPDHQIRRAMDAFLSPPDRRVDD